MSLNKKTGLHIEISENGELQLVTTGGEVIRGVIDCQVNVACEEISTVTATINLTSSQVGSIPTALIDGKVK